MVGLEKNLKRHSKMDDRVLIERERIKAFVELWKPRIEEMCRKRRKRTISKSQALRILDKIIFLIDNPDYVRVKDRGCSFIS